MRLKGTIARAPGVLAADASAIGGDDGGGDELEYRAPSAVPAVAGPVCAFSTSETTT